MQGGRIRWSGEVGAGEERWIQYAVIPTDALRQGDRMTNTVEIAGSVLGPFTRQVVTVRPWHCYLPLVRRGAWRGNCSAFYDVAFVKLW